MIPSWVHFFFSFVVYIWYFEEGEGGVGRRTVFFPKTNPRFERGNTTLVSKVFSQTGAGRPLFLIHSFYFLTYTYIIFNIYILMKFTAFYICIHYQGKGEIFFVILTVHLLSYFFGYARGLTITYFFIFHIHTIYTYFVFFSVLLNIIASGLCFLCVFRIPNIYSLHKKSKKKSKYYN